MPRGGYRPGAGRPKGTRSNTSDAPSATGERVQTPLEYMLAIMNDASTDPARRDRMAIAAAPYIHRKIAEVSKREKQRISAAAAEQGTVWEGLLN